MRDCKHDSKANLPFLHHLNYCAPLAGVGPARCRPLVDFYTRAAARLSSQKIRAMKILARANRKIISICLVQTANQW